jgi:phosphoribosylformylglycinamidine cyclo-ligase
MYGEGDYDLAGFVVGVVERARLIDGSKISDGDVVIGLPSSGLHSNGFSLVRRVFEGVSYDETIAPLELPLGRELLTPTRIYARAVAELLAADVDVRGLVHVTGGGLIDNPPRCLPAKKQLGFVFASDTWDVPTVMQAIQKRGSIADDEMRLTFNMGLGLLAVVPPEAAGAALAASAEHGGRVVGRIAGSVPPVSFE